MEACRRLSDMVRALQQFTGARVSPPARARAVRKRRRGKRGKFNIAAEELREMYKSMTIKEIADKHGVSPAGPSF
ncbi:hypothetical protein HYV49_04200 [Candidatus Pacearchaeota archaeon]|nr:hypothetical protein [Candidatus Pacearchaeota archaeon]